MEKPRFVRKALPDLEEMYRDWEINCLSGDMPRPQVVEMQRQRAFKSGVSSMFDVMKFDLPKVSDEAVCSCLIRIEGDPNEFFTTGIDLLKGTDLPNGSRGGTVDAGGRVAMEELLTMSEAAKALNVSYKTMYRWVTAGDIPAVKLPSVRGERGIVRIQMEALRQFIELSIPGPISGPKPVRKASKLAPSGRG